jgi:thioesterase domain-containing protein
MATISAGLARHFRIPATGLLMLCTLLLVSIIAPSDADAAPARRAGHVYLMRGIFNVFSLGMDQMAYKLQAAGVAATVANHTSWRGMADDMIANYRSGNREPIILMGHSAGADATISIARRLQEAGVPVALIVNFDPVSPDPVPPNVKQVVNYRRQALQGPDRQRQRERGHQPFLDRQGRQSAAPGDCARNGRHGRRRT